MPGIAFEFPVRSPAFGYGKDFMTNIPEQPAFFQVADEWAGYELSSFVF